MTRPTAAAQRRFLHEVEQEYLALLYKLEPSAAEAGEGWLAAEGRAALHEAHIDLARLRATAQTLRWALGESTTPPPLKGTAA